MSDDDIGYLVNYHPNQLYTYPAKKGAFATIVAESDVLSFERGFSGLRRRMAGVYGDHAGLAIRAKATGVVFINSDAAGEDHDAEAPGS